MKKRKIAILMLLCMVGTCLFTACEEIPYTVTDRDYYETHTGTEDENTMFPKWESDNPKEEKTTEADDLENMEPGEITNCDLRTGVETDAYGGATTEDKKVTIPANMTFHILDMDGAYFQVDYDGAKVWLPSKNCLINVKQYIPSIQVDLSLSQSPNFFNIGGNDIKGLTEKQLYTREGSIDGSEAWLRYEVAVKLLKAQELFLKDGYCIKIADAYRPSSVTGTIRDGLNEFLKTEEGQKLKQEYFGSYSVGAFLAQNASAHNYGVAIDMTLVDIDSEKELSMPSAMHTLDASSAYGTWSTSSKDYTSHGEYMRGKMVECGFSTLDSEWWHFQVNSVERVIFDIPN